MILRQHSSPYSDNTRHYTDKVILLPENHQYVVKYYQQAKTFIYHTIKNISASQHHSDR